LVQLQLVRNVLWWLLRVYAYLFHLALGLLLAGMAIVALSSGTDLTLGMLPWQGALLTRAALLLGLLDVICLVLAVTGFARWLFPLWALFALIMMLRGFFLSSYTFPGAGEFKSAVWLTIGALVAFVGSLSLFGRRRKRQ
jgi:LPXTG-motif cell wall-anchored protein